MNGHNKLKTIQSVWQDEFVHEESIALLDPNQLPRRYYAGGG